jgi:hypothetical protein
VADNKVPGFVSPSALEVSGPVASEGAVRNMKCRKVKPSKAAVNKFTTTIKTDAAHWERVCESVAVPAVGSLALYCSSVVDTKDVKTHARLCPRLQRVEETGVEGLNLQLHDEEQHQPQRTDHTLYMWVVQADCNSH